MKISTTGERLHRHVNLKIYLPQSDRVLKRRFSAQRGAAFNRGNVVDVLAAAAIELADRFPSVKYKLVPIGGASYNFVPISEDPKAGPKCDPPSLP